MIESSVRSINNGLGLIEDMIIHARGAHALFAAVELRVFDHLVDAPVTAEDLAQHIRCDPRATEILLDALVAIGLLDKSDSGYLNTEFGAQRLVSDSRDSLVSNLRYQQLLAGAWAVLPQTIRTGQPSESLDQLLAVDSGFVGEYIRGMADISRHPAAELAGAIGLTGVRRVLDIGGGPGVYAAALAENHEKVSVDLLDLEPTLELARAYLSECPAKERIRFLAGDYHSFDFGVDRYDLILLSHVTHNECVEDNRRLLRRASQALRSNGRMVVHDFVLSANRTEPLFAALFSLHMLTHTRTGRTYSSSEYNEWASDCGLVDLEWIDICVDRPTTTRVMIARKP